MLSAINKNSILNNTEVAEKQFLLKSTPKYVTIGAHAKCNANCVFCLGGKYPEFNLSIYKNLFENKLKNAFKNAEFVGFCGFGELVLMPDFIFFLRYIDLTLNENIKSFTTNGIHITPEISEILTDGRYSLMVSLHASNKKLHEALVRVKSFDKIVANISRLVALKKQKKSTLHINLVFLITAQNIDDLPDFIKFAKNLGVDRVTCNYVTVYSPEQLSMSCYFSKDKTNKILEDSENLAKEIDMELILPPKFMKYDKKDNPALCRDPWEFFYVETQGSVNPCCSAGEHIGYLTKDSFNDIWNGPGYEALRKSIAAGKTHLWCRHCLKYDLNNINDLRSHITFRPETQKEILEYIKKHKNEYPVPEETFKL
jgi:MoaA/NifB/PqqE/SkfB family radical SAM enzyme